MNASESDAVETNGGGSHPQDNNPRDSKGKHVAEDQSHDDGRFTTSNESSAGLSALAADMAHPFDQTNGLVDGLEDDHDDPENVDERTGGSRPDFIADPDGGVLGVVPAGSVSHGRRNDDAVDGEPDTDEPDTDKDEPQGP